MSNKPIYTVGFFSDLLHSKYSKFHIFCNGKSLCGYNPADMQKHLIDPATKLYILAYAECRTCLKLYAKNT